MPVKTVHDSMISFLLWWVINRGKKTIASHELQGQGVRWMETDREKTLTPATADRIWRRLRDEGVVVAKTIDDGRIEDTWVIEEIDGRKVSDLLKLFEEQPTLF